MSTTYVFPIRSLVCPEAYKNDKYGLSKRWFNFIKRRIDDIINIKDCGGVLNNNGTPEYLYLVTDASICKIEKDLKYPHLKHIPLSFHTFKYSHYSIIK